MLPLLSSLNSYGMCHVDNLVAKLIGKRTGTDHHKTGQSTVGYPPDNVGSGSDPSIVPRSKPSVLLLSPEKNRTILLVRQYAKGNATILIHVGSSSQSPIWSGYLPPLTNVTYFGFAPMFLGQEGPNRGTHSLFDRCAATFGSGLLLRPHCRTFQGRDHRLAFHTNCNRRVM